MATGSPIPVGVENPFDESTSGGGSGGGSSAVEISVASYGATFDGQRDTSGAMTSPTATLTISTARFARGDVGKIVRVVGAGTAGVTLVTTIAAYVSPTQVTLAAVAVTTVTNAEVLWGTDDSAAWSEAINDNLHGDATTPTFTGRTLIASPGMSFVTATLPTGAPNIRGSGARSTVLVAAVAGDRVLRIEAVSSWCPPVISHLGFRGDPSRLDTGIQFGDPATHTASSEVIQPASVEFCGFTNLHINIHKVWGNIGLTVHHCDFRQANYHIRSEQKVGSTVEAGMGCDTYYRNHMVASYVASIYLEANTASPLSVASSSGQTILRDNVIEINYGFGIYVRQFAYRGGIPLVLENNWMEQNATLGSVDILWADGTTNTVTPRAIYLRKASARIHNQQMESWELSEAVVWATGVYQYNTSALVRDAKSVLISERGFGETGVSTNAYTPNIAGSWRSAGNFSSRFKGKQRQVRVSNRENLIVSESFARAAVSGGSVIADGQLFDACNEYTLASGNDLLMSAGAIPTNKFIVWSIDYKWVSGSTDWRLSMTSSGPLVNNIKATTEAPTGWQTRFGLTDTFGITGFNSAIFVNGPSSGSSVLRFSAYQVLAFDDLTDAIRFIDGGAYVLDSGQPRVTWGTAIPTAGTWAVGDRRYNSAPTAIAPEGWTCTTAGTPGTWLPFGAVYSVASATIASASTVAPVARITHITGTTAIDTITIPAGLQSGGQLHFIPDGIFTTTTAGNIALASTAVVGKMLTFTYDAVTTKLYPSY